MSNAKQELLHVLKEKAEIKCACIIYYKWGGKKSKKVLKLHYSDKDYNSFLESLNFEYDAGYGSQELYGIIWLENGTWLLRGEYDGSEWWNYNILPPILKECL